VHAAERVENRNQQTAEEEIMSIETLELTVAAEVAKKEDAFELLALSIDDLDLVGGGHAVIGNLN